MTRAVVPSAFSSVSHNPLSLLSRERAESSALTSLEGSLLNNRGLLASVSAYSLSPDFDTHVICLFVPLWRNSKYLVLRRVNLVVELYFCPFLLAANLIFVVLFRIFSNCFQILKFISAICKSKWTENVSIFPSIYFYSNVWRVSNLLVYLIVFEPVLGHYAFHVVIPRMHTWKMLYCIYLIERG